MILEWSGTLSSFPTSPLSFSQRKCSSIRITSPILNFVWILSTRIWNHLFLHAAIEGGILSFDASPVLLGLFFSPFCLMGFKAHISRVNRDVALSVLLRSARLNYWSFIQILGDVSPIGIEIFGFRFVYSYTALKEGAWCCLYAIDSDRKNSARKNINNKCWNQTHTSSTWWYVTCERQARLRRYSDIQYLRTWIKFEDTIMNYQLMLVLMSLCLSISQFWQMNISSAVVALYF